MTPEERDRVLSVWLHAIRTGRDPVEALDRGGLLLTGKMLNNMEAGELYDLAWELENMSVAGIVQRYGGSSSSGLDVQRGIVALIRDRAKGREAK